MTVLDTTVGPTTAYGLRLINPAYTGSAIQVSNGSNTTQIGFVGNSLNIAALLAFAGSGDAHVMIWYDQIGSNDAVQTDFNYAPKIVAGGNLITLTTQPEILPALSYGASNVTLSAPLAFAAGPFTLQQVFSISENANSGFYTFFENLFSSSSGIGLGFTPTRQFDVQRPGISDTPSTDIVPFGKHLVQWLSNGYTPGQSLTVTPFIDGNPLTSITHNGYTDGPTLSQNTTIGGFIGLLYELVFWPAVLNTSDQAAAIQSWSVAVGEVGDVYSEQSAYDVLFNENPTLRLHQISTQSLINENPNLRIHQENLQVFMSSPQNGPYVITEVMANAANNCLALVSFSAQDFHRPVDRATLDNTWIELGHDQNGDSGRVVVAGSQTYINASPTQATCTFDDDWLARIACVQIVIS
jgi:hypothetical protein